MVTSLIFFYPSDPGRSTLFYLLGQPPRPFARTYSTYPEWVKGNVKAGLQKLKRRKAIAKHRGRVLTSGVFAVEKDEHEDRCILALCPQNSLMNPKKLWRPRFASLPHMRAISVDPGRRLRVHKIEGRHFLLSHVESWPVVAEVVREPSLAQGRAQRSQISSPLRRPDGLYWVCCVGPVVQ